MHECCDMSFEQEGDGFRLTLDDNSREVVVHLLGELRSELVQAKAATPNDIAPHMKRLFPTAYHNDDQHNEEYRRLTHTDIADAHLMAVDDAVVLLAPQRVFTRDELERFMRAINGLRLVLGTVLDISEDDYEDAEDDLETSPQRDVYNYLGWLLHTSLDQLR
jgi:hypothetical protein